MQELIVLLGCLCSIPVFGGIRVAHHLSFLGFIFCFVFLFVWVRPLFCAPNVASFFLDFPFLITLSVFSKVLFNHHICSMYFAHGTRNDHYILTLVYFSISNQCMIIRCLLLITVVILQLSYTLRSVKYILLKLLFKNNGFGLIFDNICTLCFNINAAYYSQ